MAADQYRLTVDKLSHSVQDYIPGWLAMVANSASKLAQIGPKWDKSETFIHNCDIHMGNVMLKF